MQNNGMECFSNHCKHLFVSSGWVLGELIIKLFILFYFIECCVIFFVECCRGDDDEKQYFVKWKELPYDECYWEFESDISAFQPEIERFNRMQSRNTKLSSSKQKSGLKDVMESRKKQKEFQQYEHSPDFLSGGTWFILLYSSEIWLTFLYIICFYYHEFLTAFRCKWRYTTSISAWRVELLTFLLVQTNSCHTSWWDGAW